MPNAPWGDGRHPPGGKGDKHSKNKRKHRERPCPNPPAAPTGLAVTSSIRETKVHPEFQLKIKWNGVFADEQGHKIPGGGVEIDHYEGQWAYSTTTPAITWAETEDGDPRIHRFHKKSVKGIRVVDATIVSGTTAEFTTNKAHNFVSGETVRVQDVKPNAYNGKWAVTTTPTTTTFRADIGSSPADLTDQGTVEGEPDPSYNWIVNHVARPRQWYPTARVRAWDNKNCPSDWTAWSTPIDVWSDSSPKPPVPTSVDLDFEKHERDRVTRWVAIGTFSEVVNFDYPGTPADDEADVARYVGVLELSADGSTPLGHSRRRVIEAKDADADSAAHIHFGRVKHPMYYRFKVRSVDRFNRRGDFSTPTAWQQPGAETPPSPEDVTIFKESQDRVVLDWTDPTEAGDTDIVNKEIAHYQAQIATDASFSSIYKFDKRITHSRKGFHVRLGDDQELTFYGRVRSVNEDGTKSSWIPATLNGNDSSSASPSGITLLRPPVIATFSKSGVVEVKHYGTLWTADRRYKFKKARVRVGRHDTGTHPDDGCPQGSSLIVQIKHHDTTETTVTNLFTSDNRLTIPGNKHKDLVWASDMNLTHINEDEHLSVRVSQVGSTSAGEDLVVQVVMVPDPVAFPVIPAPVGGVATVPTPSVTATQP